MVDNITGRIGCLWKGLAWVLWLLFDIVNFGVKVKLSWFRETLLQKKYFETCDNKQVIVLLVNIMFA